MNSHSGKTEYSKPFAVVIGAVIMDIWGSPVNPLIHRDSNPGKVRLNPGGVGRNIANNLRLMDVDVKFITAVGDDLLSKLLEQNCIELGMDLSAALKVPGGSSSAYLYITNPDGDMALAVSDTDIAAYITPEVLETRKNIINSAAAVVIDGNLSIETLNWVAENCTVPIFADPVSVTKGMKLKHIIPKLHTFKPNLMEAEALTGEIGPEASAKALLQTGLKRVFISLGSQGLYAAEEGKSLLLPCYPTNLKNANGGGDALVAALLRSYLDGFDLELSAKTALAAASIAVEAEGTINHGLNMAEVLKRRNNNE